MMIEFFFSNPRALLPTFHTNCPGGSHLRNIIFSHEIHNKNLSCDSFEFITMNSYTILHSTEFNTMNSKY